ncbi:hypothetical protein [methanotrophic endosymbiont of Bathymodiolus puteoserpentis (Logatchev)]|jgi:hypothetical protein|uniref:hypothetical protein n=1 Tax=methanotrophic endosymbiont of Bathymodiolus puteoserpentis (Logatchev) TaxID=343235 RepID=UPI0013CC33E2|nr:hypothetical protein [methanotrophic endosymbiont of Bathymodiolus puteoserpentis (Logatchev)]SHE19270.1 hypothetical protein BPUTEOMOX_191 [methanotrophic endosymbiont of Bathymodiolus puteoserpentis (Logatchev)]
MTDNYTAKNIKIQHITTDTWSMAISLAEEFNYNIKIIERGLEACKLAHVPTSYFIDRYLKKLDIPINEDVNAIYKELSNG